MLANFTLSSASSRSSMFLPANHGKGKLWNWYSVDEKHQRSTSAFLQNLSAESTVKRRPTAVTEIARTKAPASDIPRGGMEYLPPEPIWLLTKWSPAQFCSWPQIPIASHDHFQERRWRRENLRKKSTENSGQTSNNRHASLPMQISAPAQYFGTTKPVVKVSEATIYSGWQG